MPILAEPAVRSEPAGARAPAWALSTSCPPEWPDLLRSSGGGFFHSPAALGVSLPPGEPVFAWLRHADGAAVALGVRTHCRLSRIARHYTFATPAAAPGWARPSLIELLRRSGAAEVEIASFDAPVAEQSIHGRHRIEHRVDLTGIEASALSRQFGSTHRRHVSRGERESWQMRTLTGAVAIELLQSVLGNAADRAEQRGDPFASAKAPESIRGDAAEFTALWGTRFLAAYDGDTLLTVAMIGWGNGRAFYLLGGSTPEGYKRGSAAWLHWRVMVSCIEAGHTAYNFGGTPAAAADPQHPAHGLFRFKSGFGSEQVECAGSHLSMRPAHLKAHRVLVSIEHGLQQLRGVGQPRSTNSQDTEE